MSAPRTKPAPSKTTTTDARSGGDRTFGGAERRRHPRNPHNVSATLQPASGNADADESVRVCNLSLGGVGLICDHGYRTGSVWRITLGNGPLLLNAKVKVVSCRTRPDGKFDVGCQFC